MKKYKNEIFTCSSKISIFTLVANIQKPYVKNYEKIIIKHKRNRILTMPYQLNQAFIKTWKASSYKEFLYLKSKHKNKL